MNLIYNPFVTVALYKTMFVSISTIKFFQFSVKILAVYVYSLLYRMTIIVYRYFNDR